MKTVQGPRNVDYDEANSLKNDKSNSIQYKEEGNKCIWYLIEFFDLEAWLYKNNITLLSTCAVLPSPNHLLTIFPVLLLCNQIDNY